MDVTVSELAEHGLVRINRELARFRESSQQHTVIRLRLPPSLEASTDTPAQDSLMRLVGFAEHFATGSLLETIHRLQPLAAWSSQRLARATRDAAGSWERRREVWMQLRVDLASFPGDAALRGFVEARNAVAHGLGRLTWLQTRTVAAQRTTTEMLKAADLRVVDSRVGLLPRDVESCGRTVKAFVTWLDAQAYLPSDPS